ncbi:MAG: NAD(P)-dependent alcohol dehydrogenase [Leptospirales bacterium]
MKKTIDKLIIEYNQSKTMKAFGLTQKPVVGNVPNEMQELTIPIPIKNENDVVVKIISSTLHVDDIALAQGTALGRFYGPKEVSKEKPYVMGSNFSGVIIDKGEQVTEFKIGDEVIGIPSTTGEHGSWATYRCLDKKHIRLKPEELSHKEAVAMIIAGCVAYGMILYSKVKKGDQCLVLGASGGIGSVVVQMLKAKGAVVTGLCSTRNIDAVRSNGSDFIIDYQKEKFSDKLVAEKKKWTLYSTLLAGGSWSMNQ